MGSGACRGFLFDDGPNGGAMPSETNRSSSPAGTVISRRSLLAAAGLSALALSGTPTASARGGSDRLVTQPGLMQRFRLLRRTQTDEQATALWSSLEQDGWSAQAGDAIMHRTDPDDGDPYHTVAVPFERGDDEAVLLWTDDGPFPTQTRTFRQLDSRRYRATQHLRGPDGPTATEEVLRVNLVCSPNWTCVLSVAGAWAGTIAGCGACVIDPSRLSCLSCVGSALSATGATLGCSFCR